MVGNTSIRRMSLVVVGNRGPWEKNIVRGSGVKFKGNKATQWDGLETFPLGISSEVSLLHVLVWRASRRVSSTHVFFP